MWLFTRYGFFSAVCARQGDGAYRQPVDPERIMVRARVRAHLEALKERFPGLLAQAELRDSVRTDYAYRCFVSKATWSDVVARLAAELD